MELFEINCFYIRLYVTKKLYLCWTELFEIELFDHLVNCK